MGFEVRMTDSPGEVAFGKGHLGAFWGWEGLELDSRQVYSFSKIIELYVKICGL